jgi:aryl-alcohol dehydrogenase-like predicted oxidoreductase
VPTCRELGIGIVPFSPLGRGLLTGTVTNVDTLAENDFRRSNPRFADGNFEHNLRLVDVVKDIAGAHGCTPGQVALAWLQGRGDDVVPIPGTKRRRYLEENVGALDVSLTDEERTCLEGLQPAGDRHFDMGFVNRDTPART